MLIQASLLTVGTELDVDFGENGTRVTFSAAENHSYNDGTRENPNWKQTGTSWFNFVAYGDVANELIDELEKGMGFRLKKGVHKWRKIEGDDGEDKYIASYKILDFEPYEKRDRS